jgi:hypothetical protein
MERGSICVDTRAAYRPQSPQMGERKICAFALMSLLSLSASFAPAPSVASQVPEADKLKQQVKVTAGILLGVNCATKMKLIESLGRRRQSALL